MGQRWRCRWWTFPVVVRVRTERSSLLLLLFQAKVVTDLFDSIPNSAAGRTKEIVSAEDYLELVQDFPDRVVAQLVVLVDQRIERPRGESGGGQLVRKRDGVMAQRRR